LIVAIHQPNYLPWLGYFHKVARADRFVFLDDVQFTKNNVINRVRVLKDGAPRWLTLPVSVRLGDAIAGVVPAQADWQLRHLDALRQFYRAAPCFAGVWPDIEAIFRAAPGRSGLAAINRHFVEALTARLGLASHFTASSELVVGDVKGTERLIRIVTAVAPGGTYLSGAGGAKYQDDAAFTRAGLSLEYAAFDHPRYDQVSENFVAGLSVLDAVFHVGWQATGAMVAES
jgi:hypothetical protein